MLPANPPSAAPLDFDALERLATQARDTMAYAACRVLDGVMDHEANAIASRAQGEFLHAVSSPAVILALLAAVERGEAETALLRDLLKYVDDDAHSAALHGETDEIACAFGDRIRATLAARAHPPIQETDADAD